MAYRDLKLIEEGEGGELVFNDDRSDLITINDVQNEPYISWFGGNAYVEQEGEWWGNLFQDIEPETESIVSLTETALRENATGTRGRLIIEDSANDDLSYLSSRIEYDVSVVLRSVNSISITATFTQISEGDSAVTVLINV